MKDKSNKVSGSGTFRVGKKAHEQGTERKEFGKGAGALLPSGRYIATVLEGEKSKVNNTGVTNGSEKFTLKLRVDAVENNGTSGICYFRASLHDSTIGQFYNLMDGMGCYDEYVSELPNGDVDITVPSDSTVKGWEGKKVIVYVKHEDYKGSPQLRTTLDPIDGADAGTKPKKEKKKAAK